MVSFFIAFGFFFSAQRKLHTKLWIFSILTGPQKRDISYSRHLLLHNDRISLRETWLSLPGVICNPRGLLTSKEKIP